MEMDDSHAIAMKWREKKTTATVHGQMWEIEWNGPKIERNIDLLYRESISIVWYGHVRWEKSGKIDAHTQFSANLIACDLHRWICVSSI